MSGSRLTVVVTETHQHFIAWCLDNRRHHCDRTLINITCVGDLQKIRGLKGFAVVHYTPPRRDGDEVAAVLDICRTTPEQASHNAQT